MCTHPNSTIFKSTMLTWGSFFTPKVPFLGGNTLNLVENDFLKSPLAGNVT